MFPPVPDAFSGSVPQEGAPRPSVLLDRGFSSLAVLCAAAAAIGIAAGGADLAGADAVKLVCAALLAAALLGMGLMERVQRETAPNLAVTRIFGMVRHRLQTGAGPLAVVRHPQEESYGGLAGLIAESVASLRRLQAGRARTQEAAAAVNSALQAGREQAGALAENLRKDAASMADAASGIMVASARLEADVGSARTGSEAAQQSINQVIGRAAGLAEAVGAITTQIGRMTQAASAAAQSAFGAHAGVAALAERSALLSATAAEAGHALAEARADPARAAELAQGVAAAVATMQATVAELQAELALAVGHVAELSGVIQNQQDAGAALSHAVDRQGTEIRQVLILLQEAHAGVDRGARGSGGRRPPWRGPAGGGGGHPRGCAPAAGACGRDRRNFAEHSGFHAAFGVLGKQFFFEKKNQKTFIPGAGLPGKRWCRRLRTDRSFLLLFFKKEGLPSSRRTHKLTDLTQGSISKHVASMAGFIAAGLVFQSAYFIIDLYFVSRLGKDAVAGVAAAGNFFYLALAAAQLVGVGALSLISQAVGRRDLGYANLAFNQVSVMALLSSAIMLAGGYACAGAVSAGLGADAASAAEGRAYLFGALPSLAVMFPATALGAALRATGVVRPTMLLQTGSVILNAILAPVLIAGWGTGHALGAFGAGLASSIAACASLAVLAAILPRIQSQLRVDRTALRPRLAVWISLAKVGLPAAGEFFLLFLITGVIYWSIRRFGSDAQAGYGIGARVMQALFLPVMAIAFAAAPVAGQNFGAGLRARVIETFRVAAVSGSVLMLAMTLVCQIRPDVLVSPFSPDPAVLAIAARFLRVISWNFVAVGLVFACSGMFQALGDTRPSFVSSASRLVTYVLPCLLLAGWAGTRLTDFWYVSVVSATLQAAFSLWLLRRVFRKAVLF